MSDNHQHACRRSKPLQRLLQVRGAAILLCILAILRPQNVLKGEDAEERGIDIVIVLDLSGSMRALMDQPAQPTSAGRNSRLTRLETAKQVILDFISRRQNDRIGVVAGDIPELLGDALIDIEDTREADGLLRIY